MSERRTIGEILVSLGKITEEDVARALEHQRVHGGYFGEALVASGVVNEDELEYGLASQFDLPFVFPDPDSVDPAAAALVSPEWALANLTLPILSTEDTVRVVIDSPMKTSVLSELERRTGLEVEPALAAPTAIRELIRQVYARASAADEGLHAPIELAELLDEVMGSGAARFGISVRGAKAHGWWDDEGVIRRRTLAGDWMAALDRVLIPGPSQKATDRDRAAWDAELHRSGPPVPVEVRYLSDESGLEFLFRPRAVVGGLEERFPVPPDGIVSEIGLLARAGSARFVVQTDPEELGHAMLPHLPAIVLDPSWRSIYIAIESRAAEGEAFSLRMPADPETWAEEIEALRAFHFDVVTADLGGSDRRWTSSALDVGAVAFLLWPDGADLEPARAAGVRWRLRIQQRADGETEWSLDPLNG